MPQDPTLVLTLLQVRSLLQARAGIDGSQWSSSREWLILRSLYQDARTVRYAPKALPQTRCSGHDVPAS